MVTDSLTSNPSYEFLKRENARLRRDISAIYSRSAKRSPAHQIAHDSMLFKAVDEWSAVETHEHVWCRTSGEDHWHCTVPGCKSEKPYAGPDDCNHCASGNPRTADGYHKIGSKPNLYQVCTASPVEPTVRTESDCSTGVGGVTLVQMAENIKFGLDPYAGSSEKASCAHPLDAMMTTDVPGVFACRICRDSTRYKECPACFGDRQISMSDGSKRTCERCAGAGRVEVNGIGE